MVINSTHAGIHQSRVLYLGLAHCSLIFSDLVLNLLANVFAAVSELANNLWWSLPFTGDLFHPILQGFLLSLPLLCGSWFCCAFRSGL